MGRTKKPTAAELKKIRLVKMIREVTGSGYSPDTWNPAELSDGLKQITYIRNLVDTWNPAQLNEAIKLLGFNTIDSWNPAIIDEMKTALIRMFLPKSATGNPITLNLDGELPYTIQEAKVTFSPIQDLHGYDHPWAGGVGKNKYSVLIGNDDWTNYNDATSSSAGGVLSITATSTTNSGVYASNTNRLYIYCGSKTGVYTLSAYVKASASGTLRMGFSGLSSQDFSITTEWQRISITVTLDGSAHSIIFYSRGDAVTYDIKDVQLETGETATPYSPYSNICPISGWDGLTLNVSDGDTEGTDYSATFSDTLYNGSYDFVSGEGTSNYEMVDLGDLDYTYVSENAYFYAIVPNIYVPSQSSDRNKGLISSQYKLAAGTSANTMTNGEMLRASGRVYLKNTDYTDAETFKAAMDGVQLCYELATPTTIELEAQEIETLSGVNVFSTDGDSLTLKYQIDLS